MDVYILAKFLFPILLLFFKALEIVLHVLLLGADVCQGLVDCFPPLCGWVGGFVLRNHFIYFFWVLDQLDCFYPCCTVKLVGRNKTACFASLVVNFMPITIVGCVS